LGIKPKNPPMELSTFNEKAVRDYLTLGQDIYLDPRTKNILEKISAKVETLDAQGISDWVIQVLYETILDELNQDKKSDSTINKYLSELITIENILMILRSKRYQMGHTYVKENLISGGLIDLSILETLYDLSHIDIGNYLKLHYDDGVVDAFKDENSSQFIKRYADAFD
jgi:vacuolar-type H+-ATPase subunit C/Vma6